MTILPGFTALLRRCLGKAMQALGNAAEVRNGDFSFHDTGQRLHEAFGLA